MIPIPVTAQQRANALEALNVMWPSVPPENVFPRLLDWRDEDQGSPPTCGTLACFGGWSEWWPPFRQQLGAEELGACGWGELAGLFGPSHLPEIDRLFNTRGGIGGGHPADADFTGTDHELVTNRLNWLIENSEVIE